VFQGIKATLIRLLGGSYTPPKPKETPKEASVGPQEIHSVWDYLDFRENTQAHHLTSVIGFEELVDMDEIRRRIQEQFHVEYKNERSLYPYLKTLVDIGLFETLDVGGKRKWRKKTVLIRRKMIEPEEETQTATAQASARTPLHR
jgi:hypothetical protein